MSRIEYRKCVPSDAEKAIPLILASGPDAFAYVFQNKDYTATDFLTFAFCQKGGEFSFDNHTAIIVDGNLVGVGAVFSGKQANKFFFKDVINIFKLYKFNAISILIRGLKIEQIICPPKKNEFAIAHIAISETQQSRGFGQKLIDFLIQETETTPTSYFVLDVSEENPRAKALYERIGFVVNKKMVSDLKSKYGFVVNHFRMVLKS